MFLFQALSCLTRLVQIFRMNQTCRFQELIEITMTFVWLLEQEVMQTIISLSTTRETINMIQRSNIKLFWAFVVVFVYQSVLRFGQKDQPKCLLQKGKKYCFSVDNCCLAVVISYGVDHVNHYLCRAGVLRILGLLHIHPFTPFAYGSWPERTPFFHCWSVKSTAGVFSKSGKLSGQLSWPWKRGIWLFWGRYRLKGWKRLD